MVACPPGEKAHREKPPGPTAKSAAIRETGDLMNLEKGKTKSN